MTRHNRVKQIMERLGFRVEGPRQPLSKERIARLKMTSHRIRQIMDNKPEAEDINLVELDALCEWLGASPDDILIPKGEEDSEEVLSINPNIRVNVKPRRGAKNQTRLFANV